MFSDFYEKFNFKKTTPEEKKEVVKNTGKYFPNEHSNKIKGIDELANAVVDNAMKKQDEIVNIRPAKGGHMWKKCEICGKTFESYRGIQKYCSGECLRKVESKQRKERKERKRNDVVEPTVGTKYKNCKVCGKIFKPYSRRQKYCGKACAKEAENEKQKERYQNKKADFDKLKETLGNGPFTQVETIEIIEPQTQPEENSDMKYLTLMQKAISIVSVVKSTSDVKECIDKVFDALNED